MSRSPTRTPPIRINPFFFTKLAQLHDSDTIASVVRMAAHHIEFGQPMTVGEFGESIGQDGLFLHVMLQEMTHLIDPEFLSQGLLVVTEIASSLERRNELISKRSEAAHKRYLKIAAEQKSQGSEIKLTRGRVAKASKVATAPVEDAASSSPVCTHVHKNDDYAHMYKPETCTHVHNEPLDAHMCINPGCTHVHKTALDAHMCMSDARESDENYAHMCIPPASEDEDATENVGFDGLDRSDMSSHARARASRADLSISNYSSEKNKRVESTREASREREPARNRYPAVMTGKGNRTPKPVATMSPAGSASRQTYTGRSVQLPTGSRPSAGSSASEAPAEFLQRLQEAGPVNADAAQRQISEWIEKWGEPFVRSGVEAIPDKEIARPLSYLKSILTNLVNETGEPTVSSRNPKRPFRGAQESETPTREGGLPRRVKRRISMPPGASWELVGWTARGREGDSGPSRKQIWRTESGDLRYMDAPASEIIPTYEEDPGVYAYD